MKIHLSGIAFIFVLIITARTFAQQPTPSPTPDETVKVTTALVQMDVVVTDKNGTVVTGLQPEDFTITQDGKTQKIYSLTYVDSTTSERTRIETKEQKAEKKTIPTPPSNVRSKQGRVITFVVDDGNCLASSGSLAFMRDDMKKFIEQKMLPDDRVAIYRTRGGASLMQIYTSNKEVLKRQLNKIMLIPEGGCGSAFDTLRDNSTLKTTGSGAQSFENDESKQSRKDNEDRNQRNQVTGTLGVLSFVVERLKNVPQRKELFLLSDGIVAKFDSETNDALRELADKAARASVVINTVSAKGVTIPGMLEARDEVLPGIGNGTDNTGPASQDRIDEEAALNTGISYLAYATGGKFTRNSNDMAKEITRVLDSTTGYYLVGYEPDDETFKGKAYHKIDIRVTRPELKVSARKGFYGKTDKETQIVYKTPDSPLFQAISSPFDESGIDIQMTTLLGKDEAANSYVRTIFHVPGRDITFADEANGDKKAVFDVVAVVLDEKGKVAEEFNRTYPIRIPARGVPTVQQNGLDFSTDIAFKKPGVYTLRLAVRDNNSKRLGTAGDFVEVPNPKSDKFFVSGLITSEISSDGKPKPLTGRPVNAAFAPVFSLTTPSIRQFRSGSQVPFVFTINNAKSNGTGSVQLTKEVRLYRNGELVATEQETAIETTGGKSSSSIIETGVKRLDSSYAPGEYALQVIIRDKAANKVSSQSIDFEVVD
jgi:VWFA-related protein